MSWFSWLFPKRNKEEDLNKLEFSESAYPPNYWWSLVEFIEKCGNMQIHNSGNTIDKAVFINSKRKITVVCVSASLKYYSAEAIKRSQDKIFIKVMPSGKYCMCLEWEKINLN